VLALGAAAGRAGTIATFETALGSFDVQLLDNETPITVGNFLNYVTDGDYTNSFFHRLAYGFVLQGGGFGYDDANGYYYVPTDPNIPNEFNRSNVRGTIAMAKTEEGPDSATNQFFFNLADNSAELDYQNGGFTVFGYVLGDGMNVVDRLAGFPPNPDNVEVWDARDYFQHPAFGQLPLIDFPNYVAIEPYLEMVYEITARESAAPGDANSDGAIDFWDYLTVKAHLGTDSGATWEDGDFDGDEDVDRSDFQILRDHFGKTSGAGKVPEPAALALFLAGGLGLLRRRSRRG
jgi:cyclophilin family peptidyl-prolyl cis-trans isomerase